MVSNIFLGLLGVLACYLMTDVVGFHLSSASSPIVRPLLSSSLSLVGSRAKIAAQSGSPRTAFGASNGKTSYIPSRLQLHASSMSTASPTPPSPVAPAVGKLGVLFLNLGGPERLEDVEPFLYNLFADPDIIRLPLGVNAIQKLIALYISKTRSGQSREAYASIGGGSPIVKYTAQQSKLVEEALKARGFNASAYFAMRYWNPMTDEVLEHILRDGIETLVIVPLYPHFSLSTSGSSLKLLNSVFEKNPQLWLSGKMRHTVAPTWFHRPGYVRAMANLVVGEVSKLSPEQQAEGVDVLFSAHGVPQGYLKVGDLYQSHIEESMLMISREVGTILADSDQCPAAILPALKTNLRFHLSYQSRVGPVPWLRPYTDDKIRELGKKGARNLAVVPIAFVSEHIETLEEIDGEYRELAHESGVHNWIRVPALNTDASFIADMTRLVEEALVAPAMSVSDAAFLRSTRAAEAAAVRETRLREAISCRSVRGRIGGALGSATSSVADTLRGWLRM